MGSHGRPARASGTAGRTRLLASRCGRVRFVILIVRNLLAGAGRRLFLAAPETALEQVGQIQNVGGLTRLEVKVQSVVMEQLDHADAIVSLDKKE